MKETKQEEETISWGESPWERLKAITTFLRSERGCPWDRKQTIQSLAPLFLEEVYELIDITTNWPETPTDEQIEHFIEELGDVLFHLVLLCQICAEKQWFGIDRVVDSVGKKLIRRHPHVFGNQEASTDQEALYHWEKAKRKEKSPGQSGIRLPKGLPALLKAERMGSKAARVGFDWPDAPSVLDKVKEELFEWIESQKHQKGGDEKEFGDLLFALVQYARKMGISAEVALNKANDAFLRRFQAMEKDEQFQEALLANDPKERMRKLNALWERVKHR